MDFQQALPESMKQIQSQIKQAHLSELNFMFLLLPFQLKLAYSVYFHIIINSRRPIDLEMHKPQPISYMDFNRRYNIVEKIGQGSYGNVFRIQDCKTKQYRAVKKVTLKNHQKMSEFLREIQIQEYLAHPLVLKIFEFYIHQAHYKIRGDNRQIGIVTESGECSLLHIIKDRNEDFSVEEIINFAHSFVELFAYFQELKIVHRDIKPDNFVRFGKGLQCKLIDFGICTHVNDIRHLAGSFYYLSPILKKIHSNRNPNRNLNLTSNPFKDDVYSFGLTLYELITRKTSRYDPVRQRNLSRVSLQIYDYTKNEDIAQIMELMLEYQEKKRPDFIELLQIFNKKFTFYDEKKEEEKFKRELQIEQANCSRLSIQDKSERPLLESQKIQIFNQPNEEKDISMHTRLDRNQKQESKENQIFDIDRTIKQEPQLDKKEEEIVYHKKCFCLDSSISIMCIIKIKQFIICGCRDGSLYVINTQRKKEKHIYKFTKMAHSHKNYICSIQKDEIGNIWTVSGDGTIIVWDRIKLMRCLLNFERYKTVVTTKKNVFGHKNVKTTYEFEVDPLVTTEIKTSVPKKAGVTAMYCFDKQNYALGFTNGQVLMVVDGNQKEYFIHSESVTSIKKYNEFIFTSSIDGSIKKFDVKAMCFENKYFHCNSEICDFQVSVSQNKLSYQIITTDGKYFKVKSNDLNEPKNKNKSASIDTMAATFTKDGPFTLTSSGYLMHKGEVIQTNDKNGWSCLVSDGDKGLIMGSMQGEIAWIEWQP